MSTVYADAGRVLSEEFEEASLGDARRVDRLKRMANQMERRPAAGFPEMMGSPADLEGCYRFLNNEAVTMNRLLKPHIDQTVQRATECDRVLALHDETTFRFDHADQREAVGELRSGGPGFYGRFSLLVDGDRKARPLGVSDASIYLRDESGQPIEAELEGIEWDEGETQWWLEHIERTESRVSTAEKVIHVMDAGFEAYERFDALEERDSRFVARLSRNRKIRPKGEDEWTGLRQLVESMEAQTTREVTIASRKEEPMPPEQREKHPPREKRTTELKVGGKSVQLRRPQKGDKELAATRSFELVYVWEASPGGDVEPVEWILLTNLEVQTVEELNEVLDIYQGRWRVEQLHKALKTGCGFDERQLENRRSLLNALGLSLPMAWLLLAVRSVAHSEQPMPADRIVDEAQLEILREVGSRPIDDEHPTAQKVVRVIAEMGGHWPSNGPPGWQVLSRGLRQLITLTKGWRVARAKM